jgi:hypothetical protein
VDQLDSDQEEPSCTIDVGTLNEGMYFQTTDKQQEQEDARRKARHWKELVRKAIRAKWKETTRNNDEVLERV